MRTKRIFPATTAIVAMVLALVLGIGGGLKAQEEHGVTPADLERGGQIYLSNLPDLSRSQMATASRA